MASNDITMTHVLGLVRVLDEKIAEILEIVGEHAVRDLFNGGSPERLLMLLSEHCDDARFNKEETAARLALAYQSLDRLTEALREVALR